jgi:hypothetical protein
MEVTFASTALSKGRSSLAQKLFSMGKPTCKVRANKTLRLQALVPPGFWAVMTAES